MYFQFKLNHFCMSLEDALHVSCHFYCIFLPTESPKIQSAAAAKPSCLMLKYMRFCIRLFFTSVFDYLIVKLSYSKIQSVIHIDSFTEETLIFAFIHQIKRTGYNAEMYTEHGTIKGILQTSQYRMNAHAMTLKK